VRRTIKSVNLLAMSRTSSFVGVLLSLRIWILCLNLPISFGIKMQILPGVEKCIQEEFAPDLLITGTLEVTPVVPNKGLQVKIVENSHVLYENTKLVDKGTFAFTSQDTTYIFCFKEDGQGGWTDGKRLIDIKFKIESDPKKEQPDVATKEQLQPLERELKNCVRYGEMLEKHFVISKEGEADHRDTSESTNSRVAAFSIMSIVIVAGGGMIQSYYLQRYLKSKKLI